MFQEPARAARGLPAAAIAAAGVAILLAVALLLLLGRRHTPAGALGGAATASAAYAPKLILSDVVMSESTSFSGGKETFLDGRITNSGPSIVSGATVEVTFPTDAGGTPQQETVPVTLIRTRQPYIDTEPMTAAPLAPAASAEFRLTFDDVRPDWNQSTPAIRVTAVTVR